LEFERTDISLREGDGLILYSDGVSEAFNSEQKCYGNEHLLADAAEFTKQSASEIATGLLGKVRDFAGDAPQSDDIAILVLKVCGERADSSKKGAL
jgi:sigma-B regulation protein RsbU (phosphoserine phosphatase)